jgi:hypothetical protein
LKSNAFPRQLQTAADAYTYGSAADQDYTIEIGVAATPLPAVLPLFAGGLGLVGFLSRRKKQKAAIA